MTQETPSKLRFWLIRESPPYSAEFTRMLEDDLNIGVRNYNDLISEIIDQRRALRGDRIPSIDDIWFKSFEHAPKIRLPTSYYPDYFESKGCRLVSPRLFPLLDQPRGTLQGWKTEIEWVGPNPPGRIYLWLSYIPRVPTYDIERSGAEKVEYPDPDGGPPVVRLRYLQDMVLRHDMASPFGVFRAAEALTDVLATDAVAEAVTRAGCTGIEFRDPETHYSSSGYGALYRRGPFGVERRPESEYYGFPDPDPED